MQRSRGRTAFVSATFDDGSPIDLEKHYTVIMPDFVASGGDGTAEVMKGVPADRIQTSFAAPIRDVLIEQFLDMGNTLEPKTHGRITVLNKPSK